MSRVKRVELNCNVKLCRLKPYTYVYKIQHITFFN